MTDQPNLDDVYPDDKDPTAAPTEIPVETKPDHVDVDHAVEEDEGDKDETEAPPAEATEEVEKDTRVPIEALLSEREKRQKLEAKLKEFEEQSKPEPRPDVFEDQDGAFSHLEQTLDQKVKAVAFSFSEKLMRREADDYDSRRDQFLQMAQDNPHLISQLQASDDPARFAYETAVKLERIQKLENVDDIEAELEARIRDKVRKEIEAEMSAKSEKQQANREAVTPSLASSTSVAGTTNPVNKNPTLDDII